MATSPNAHFQPSNVSNNVVFFGSEAVLKQPVNNTASPTSNQEAYFWRVAALMRRDKVLAEQLRASALAEPRLAPPRVRTLPQCYNNNNKINMDPRVQFQAALGKQYMQHVYSRDRSSGDANAYKRALWINPASRGVRKPLNPAARLMQYGYVHSGGATGGGRRELMANMIPRPVLNALDQVNESDDGIDLTLRL